MKTIQIVFSPTGGTQKTADLLLESWAAPHEIIDLSDPQVDFSALPIEKEDAVLLAVPSFGGRVPEPAAQRMARLRGNGARCVLLCVYGNRAYEDTLAELYDLAQNSGFIPVAAVAAVAEHSILRQYAAGRPDAQDAAQLRAFSAQTFSRIQEGNFTGPLSLPGNRPYKNSGGGGMVPKAGSTCVRCSLCAENCPTRAIPKDNPQTTDKAACISCMRCVGLCPHQARQLNGMMLSAAALALKKACSVRKENELFL